MSRKEIGSIEDYKDASIRRLKDYFKNNKEGQITASNNITKKQQLGNRNVKKNICMGSSSEKLATRLHTRRLEQC